MQTLFSDLRYSLRQFRLSPAFTATAAFTLALGIGGTTAIFSLIHSIMLRSLPVSDPAALYRVGDNNECCMEGGLPGNWGLFSFPFSEQIAKVTPEFESMTVFQGYAPELGVRRSGGKTNLPVHSEFVDGRYFSTLGIRPYTGRLLTQRDDSVSAPPVVVASFNLWQAKYDAAADFVGSTLIVDGHPFTVAGIAPPGFFGETLRSDPPDLWLPLQKEPMIRAQNSMLHQSASAWLRVIGRVRSGESVDPVAPRLTSLLRHWLVEGRTTPAEERSDVQSELPRQVIHVVPAGSGVLEMKERYSQTLYLLLSVCGLVLAIACANVANLMLARSLVRRKDISLRMALGASRARLIRQTLTESIALSLLGGLLGLFFADAAGRLILALAFELGSAVPLDTQLSSPILGFALGASILTGIVFGVVPASFATHMQPIDALRGANRTVGERSSRPQQALVITQATLSLVLVAGACMLTRSLGNLEHQNLGLDLYGRVQVEMNPAPSTYSQEQLDVLYRNLLSRLKQVEGIESAGLAMVNPFTGNWNQSVYIDGHPRPAPSVNADASFNRVSTGFFETAGQSLVRGRLFDERDRDGSIPIAVVNESFAKKFFRRGEEPLGAYFGMFLFSDSKRFEIAGIVRDAKYTQPNEPVRPMFFLPFEQHAQYSRDILNTAEKQSHFAYGLLLHTSRSVASIEPELRKLMGEVDPNITVLSVKSMRERVDQQFSQQRAVARLASLFGIVALVLAAVGLYGVTAYTVARRTGEIGVRMTLGADRASVIRLVLRGTFQNVGIGLLMGIPLAIGAGKLMESQLYEVGSIDPIALTVALGSLSLAAFAAATLPAARAASVDPAKALQTE